MEDLPMDLGQHSVVLQNVVDDEVLVEVVPSMLKQLEQLRCEMHVEPLVHVMPSMMLVLVARGGRSSSVQTTSAS
eukprot:10936360-Prorocentrum_lima.AAC.1